MIVSIKFFTVLSKSGSWWNITPLIGLISTLTKSSGVYG